MKIQGQGSKLHLPGHQWDCQPSGLQHETNIATANNKVSD